MKKEPQNKEIVLAEHPSGVPTQSTFKINTIEMPDVKDGQVMLKSLYVSVDPGMRGFMDKGHIGYTGQKFNLNEPITSRTVAQVVKSRNGGFKVGSIVHGRLAWQKFQSINSDTLELIDPDLAPISTAASLLGIPGLAAYFGMLKIGRPKKGETVVVSGAAGSVGGIASQIAKIKGCKVIAIAGSSDKINYLENELGLDRGINYKKTADMTAAVKQACPDGVDIFFDNVGGEIFDAVFANINKKARIAICGQIAEYNASAPTKGPRPMHNLINKSALMEGFVVFDFKDEFEDAKKQLASWYNNSELKYRENLVEGFENIPTAFIGLFSGQNIGKQMVKVAAIE
ncbi:NADP-dependent oxidoreductase [Maribacter sp. ACAM166]|uniref:NADP-dependent oxidoreductase n=1 Tax=Maribacter sp. ACAM166 TaxID=2508996 RepID=UPI001BB276EA|nr:NADP-dependent oxidoreductase [Maribacter sp. ACAM166]